jgi:TrmH family RNA methyltransferase
VQRIASRHNPIVARYRAAARGDAAGAMLLDGAHLVADALAAGIRFRDVAVAAEVDGDTLALARRLEHGGVSVVSVTAPVLAAISPVRSPSPIVALAERPDPPPALFDGPPALVVIAADIQDPGNLGAIVRVAEAGGATGVIAAGAAADPFGWKALRGSMGSALRLPIHVVRDGGEFAEAKRAGCRIVAAAPRGGRSMFDLDFTRPTALVIGGEGPGLSAERLAEADDLVTIPMAPPVESLNAATTAALLVYEARRQRIR